MKTFLDKVRNVYSNFIYVIRTKSFYKLFLSLVLFIILPYSIIAGRMIYFEYDNALDWNQRFQLIRIQLLAIDIENQIQDQLQKEFTKPKKNSDEIRTFCKLDSSDSKQEVFFQMVRCHFSEEEQSYFLLSDGNGYRIYPSTFIEEALLDSPFSDPNEGLFLLNSKGDFGISGFIEDDFLVSEEWKEKTKSSLQTNSNLPTLKEVRKDDLGFFLVGVPLYGLPIHLFVVSPINLVLQPILSTLKTNLTTLSGILLFTFFISFFISLKEIESKQKLKLILKEFPHAAILFDSTGNVLLENSYIEPTIQLKDVFIYQDSFVLWLKKEVLVFLKEIKDQKMEQQQLRKEELEVFTNNGENLLLEITYQIWYLEQDHQSASGALILVQDVTKKRLEFEKEMDYARDLQKKYLPSRIQIFPKLDYEILYRPLIQVGGDYYDYIDLGNNRYIFALGDVIGHGVKAAMMMTVLKVLFHQIAKTEPDPSQILLKMNEGIATHFPDPYAFVPFLFLLFDLNQNFVYYGNAGHPGMVHFSKNGPECYEKLNPMFGMLPKFSPKVLEFPITKGDRFYLFTDGLKDVENFKQEKLWENELMGFFHSMENNHMSFIKQELDSKIRSFSEGKDLLDDITWIGIDII
ncbi:serine/threonine protein phosphatase [Leptospira biflexa]|uniref:SpoIIE family protein phosphatase n=1 Tax=Leptospira biflexa TaxID=172 RepID=UPI001083C8D9|nr:SpoIIE family protein phosphatase [Leptospira biflexa]TGM36807.1 serine/threonine protein phosphatase [Leptospira biflexa]TGM39791.1 serine/threonine protein phosphatase [Leptospira biflexa]TGM48617.1 serine/threonine protein phosphatase [Leptospira biflexa]TGM48917.1 serine/threonine protein phosphatase [Leptospira biflexa]